MALQILVILLALAHMVHVALQILIFLQGIGPPFYLMKKIISKKINDLYYNFIIFPIAEI